MTEIAYQYGYEDGTVNIKRESDTSILIFRIHEYNGQTNQRGTSFTATNKEQADRWEKIFINNPDLSKRLIF